MASFETLKNGRVRASVYASGIRDSKTLPTAKKAKSWAQERESELSKLEAVIDSTRTFKDLFTHYSNKISVKKNGAHWEQIRLKMLIEKYPTLCALKLVKTKREDIEDWVNLRLLKAKPSTVNRELNLISHTLTWARRWRWMSLNPIQGKASFDNGMVQFSSLSLIVFHSVELVFWRAITLMRKYAT